MATKFFKNKQQIKEEVKEPRKMEEIKADYETLRNRSGDVQYQIYALKRDLENINQQLVNINYEAAARNELDKKAAEVKNEVAK
jgi:hypothetical protein